MAVQKAIKSGRISTTLDEKGQNKIDAEAAARDWDLNTDQSRKREPKPKDDERPGQEPPPPSSSFGSGGAGGKPHAQAAPTASSAYASARAVREEYQARIAKIEFEKKIGKLVEADKIRLEAFQAARLTRDILLNIPNKIAHELAAESDSARIHILLTDSITKALEELVAEGQRRMEIKESEV